jgi:hypothetical protein
VNSKQSKGDSLDAKSRARRVRNIAARRLDPECVAEVIEMVVGRKDGGRLAARMNCADDLVLECVGALVGGEHSSGSSEEGIVRDDRVHIETKRGEQLGGPLEPLVAVGNGTVRVAEVHVFVLSECLHPRRVKAWFVAEAVTEDLETAATSRKASRAMGIERMTRSGAQGDV